MSSASVARVRGFSVIEVLMVVGISGILVVGLTSMIEVPSQMAERQVAENPSISNAETTLTTLDRDIRFATDVRVPAAGRVEVDGPTGTIVWEWNGLSARPLTRTADGSTVEVLRNVDATAFSLTHATAYSRQEDSQPVTNTGVQAASFSNFSLRPGFSLDGLVRGLIAVFDLPVLKDVGGTYVAGIFFNPRSLEDDDAVPTQVRMRLQRNGTNDLQVRLWEEDPSNRANPRRDHLVATGTLLNRQIPVATAEVGIPLTTIEKVRKDKSYFLELRSGRGGLCARVEGRFLTNILAAATHPTTFLHSSNSGTSFSALTLLLDASQATFALDVVKSQVSDVDDDVEGPTEVPGFAEVQIPVRVGLQLAVLTSAGVERVEASFPILNKLALVNR